MYTILSMSIEGIKKYWLKNWNVIISYGALCLVLATALVYKINSLVGGYSAGEISTFNASQNLHGLLDNPLNAPYLVLVKLFSFVLPNTPISARATSILLGAAALIAFYLLVKSWHGLRTAVIATLLIGVSAGFSHTARLGTPDVTQLLVFVLVAAAFWANQSKNWPALLTCAAITLFLIYTPGVILFLVVGLIWKHRTIIQVFKNNVAIASIGLLTLLLAFLPLIWSFVKDPSLIKTYLGFPQNLPSPLTYLADLIRVPFHVLVHNQSNPALWLGGSPLLDAFSLAMFLLAIYLYLRHIKLGRSPLFIGLAAVSTVLIALQGAVTITVLLPFIYILIALGVDYVLEQWYIVFPRNPIARGLGQIILIAVIGLSCSYQLQNYFVAWPNASQTKQAFSVSTSVTIEKK